MSSTESYDGLCGIIAPFASSDLQLRCGHSLGHHGDHSWEKYRENFTIRGCTPRYEYYEDCDMVVPSSGCHDDRVSDVRDLNTKKK